MSSLDVDRSTLRSPRWTKRGSYIPTPLTRAHIQEALSRSEDYGITLVFLKKNLTDIGASVVEELATVGRNSPDDGYPVERLALGNNYLTTLPMEFAHLSRLRYVNLRSNAFTTFPDVLTLMPSLDTLDISHNKINQFPSRPGELIKLKVFCVSRNKITRIPEYLSRFTNLAVLEIERNPIEWPPITVMSRPAKFPNAEAMKEWIHNLQTWIESETGDSKGQDDSGFAESESWSRFPVTESEFDAGVTPHARSFSLDSNLSVSSLAESDIETPSSSYDRPPPLHLGILSTDSAETSPTRSFDSYLPSPADSDSFAMNDPTAHPSPTENGQRSAYDHSRNASFASGMRNSRRNGLSGKKSMPDLRTAKFPFAWKAHDPPERVSANSTSKSKIPDDFSMPSPLSQRQDSNSSASSGTRQNKPPGNGKEPVRESPPPRASTSSIAYFRRLSTLPLSTISDTLPKPLISLIECARSILFAVCQIYQTLEHYTVHAIDDRLSSVLRKVLDPASLDMMQLINYLERFDAISRKILPPPPVCRGVVESCKDTVAVFGKAVGVLTLQLKVIATGDDVRYLRSMLLVLYGAAAEISWAWQAMIPHIEAIKPLLRSKPHPTPSPNMSVDPYPSSIPSTSQLKLEQPSPLLSLRAGSAGVERTRVARRHAGSFSSKDVEIGKKLPSYDDAPTLSRGVAVFTPTLRAPKRQATLAPMAVTISSPSPTSPLPSSMSASWAGESSRAIHSRTGSQSSLPGSSASSSPSLPPKTAFLELPPSSKTQVDKEAIQAVQNAVEVAPVVWNLMEEVLGDVLEAQADVRESLDRARSVTRRLSDLIRALKEGDSTRDRGSLREDAHIFLKTVVQLSNIAKTYNGVRSSALRNNMYKLTNSTEEFAILLHVSSFSPASTPRPYSPMLSMSASQSSFLNPAEDSRLQSSFSRSARAPGGFKVPSPTAPHDGSRSAPPNQTFKMPVLQPTSW
ncbi:RAM signaling pathway protein-domain-containing protein [Desarmillaria tabescens]|uniref:RAM signaling pathway protein-domain-containing protein n=1 Tax=Armillaria tabescens TaxID=1929756 RepID=A0AA39N5S1_ARMTA|nr:RAM signaling pathway protein-domain-containing protein [Desarmillaria tabescens]KAK0458449.1 RAM signaling pathway protein-domain-containing protein [Desarmillaria tabescens]